MCLSNGINFQRGDHVDVVERSYKIREDNDSCLGIVGGRNMASLCIISQVLKFMFERFRDANLGYIMEDKKLEASSHQDRSVSISICFSFNSAVFSSVLYNPKLLKHRYY